MLKFDVVSTLKYDVVSSLKYDVVSTLKSDVVSTLKSDVVSTLKSDVVSALKFDVKKTLKMSCFPDVEINNVVSTLKISCSTLQPKINLKTMLKKRCVPVGKLVSTNLINSALRTSTAAICLLNDHSLDAPVTSDKCHCLISFVLDQSICQERIESDKIPNEKVLPTEGLEPTALRFVARCSND